MSNNPVYTYHEKQHFNLGSNSRKRKIGIESLRRFNHCALCLGVARDAHITHSGIIYCKECIYADLLAQKQDIKRAKKRLGQLKQKQREGEQRRQESHRSEAIAKFDKAQVVGKAGHEESVPSKSAALPSFWLSSLQPNISDDADISDQIRSLESHHLVTMCRQAAPIHPLSLKDLYSVKLKYTDRENEVAVCSGCDRTLNNSTKMFVTKSCHNVLCAYCIDTLYTPAKQCPVCDEKVGEDDLITISVEGTGFAGGGGVMLKKRTGTLGLN